uniref:Uncharacterized protein n=2 Tax=Eutreptiella gymnastica TaxID=73025 RepID=A0A7S4FRQ6_9EUGL
MSPDAHVRSHSVFSNGAMFCSMAKNLGHLIDAVCAVRARHPHSPPPVCRSSFPPLPFTPLMLCVYLCSWLYPAQLDNSQFTTFFRQKNFFLWQWDKLCRITLDACQITIEACRTKLEAGRDVWHNIPNEDLWDMVHTFDRL